MIDDLRFTIYDLHSASLPVGPIQNAPKELGMIFIIICYKYVAHFDCLTLFLVRPLSAAPTGLFHSQLTIDNSRLTIDDLRFTIYDLHSASLPVGPIQNAPTELGMIFI